jgi:hypothetical protein
LDPGILGTVSLNGAFFTGLLSIILIDVVLAGDNAVVIAMAVKSLPKAQRTKGILFGAGAAVVHRIVMTFFAYKLVELPYVKLMGGGRQKPFGTQSGSLWSRISECRLTMSLPSRAHARETGFCFSSGLG